MSLHVIKVPDIGEGIAEVELVAWRVKPGEPVAEDQILADVMTDKATVEIPSPVGGRVLSLGGEIGQMLAVGADLIRIDVVGEAAASQPPAPAPAAVAAAPAAPTIQTAAAAPSAPTPAIPLSPPPVAERAASRPIASPALRARAWERGIDLREVVGSGPGGRIMQRDLDAFRGHATPPQAASPASASAATMPPRPRAGSTATVAGGEGPADAIHTEKIVGLRRKIAQKMQEAKRRIPHFSYVEEIDVGELEALRAELNAGHAKERGHLTVLPFLVRAMVLAAGDVPQVNALFDDEAGVLSRHEAVHLGIATQTDNGLMVPVLRHAEARDLWANAAEIARLAAAARSGRIVRDELAGSTITLSSLGRLGGIVSTPVINHPEVAIVGVNRIVERPVAQGGAVVVRPIMNLSSSFDHRVVDGATAAEFVQRLRQRLEHPALLFVD